MRSWWIVFTLVPFGWLSWLAFLIIAVRGRNGGWLVAALVYLAAAAASLVLASTGAQDSAQQTAGGAVALVLYPVALVHALIVRRRANEPADGREMVLDVSVPVAVGTAPSPRPARDIAREHDEMAKDIGIG